MYLVYSLLLTAAFVLLLPLFLLRREKYAAGFKQRLGNYPPFLHDGRPVIWLHCVSVGETNAARPLVDGLLRAFPGHRLVVSTTTKTGQELAQKAFSGKADAVFYFPFDWKFSVAKAIQNYKPSIVLLMETEIWPRFIREARASGAKVAIVNGRLSERSARRYSIVSPFIRRVLADIDLALMQGENDLRRITALGLDQSKARVTGNLKFDLQLNEADEAITQHLNERFQISDLKSQILDLRSQISDTGTQISDLESQISGLKSQIPDTRSQISDLRSQISVPHPEIPDTDSTKAAASRPLVVAASTHEPEERWMLEAFCSAAAGAEGPKPRLLIAPRHPERFETVAKIAREFSRDPACEWPGYKTARRSEPASAEDTDADVIILDSIGELRAVYPLAEIVFVGGSLIPHGGQSILEPAAAGKAIITGHHTHNFADAVRTFLGTNALVQLPDRTGEQIIDELFLTISDLLEDEEQRRTLGRNAAAVMKANRGATARTIDAVRSVKH